MHSSKPLQGTTNEDQTLSFHPENQDSVLDEQHQKKSHPMLLPHLPMQLLQVIKQ
jgi:hypothetical protein